jgi:hypothetical protein
MAFAKTWHIVLAQFLQEQNTILNAGMGMRFQVVHSIIQILPIIAHGHVLQILLNLVVAMVDISASSTIQQSMIRLQASALVVLGRPHLLVVAGVRDLRLLKRP